MFIQTTQTYWNTLKNSQTRFIAYVGLVFGLVSTIGLVYIEQTLEETVQTQATQESLHHVADSIDQALYQRLIVVSALGLFGESYSQSDFLDSAQKETLNKTFRSFGRSLDSRIPGLTRLQLKLSSTDLHTLDFQPATWGPAAETLLNSYQPQIGARVPLEAEHTTIFGPVEIAPNQEVIIFQQKIILPRTETQGQVTGGAIAVFDMDQIYLEAGIPGSLKQPLVLQTDSSAVRPSKVLFGNPAILDHKHSSLTLALPGQNWMLASRIPAQLRWGRISIIAGFGAGVSSLICLVILHVAKADQALQKAYTELRNANQLKDQFLSTVSHELRTPLNAILGLSEGLKAEASRRLEPQQFRALNTIEESGQHLLDLINDILALSKAVSEESNLELAPVMLDQLFQECLKRLETKAYKKSIEIKVFSPEALPPVELDQDKLKQILFHLLDNAIKFTPEKGSVTVTVTRERAYDPCFQTPLILRIAVQDTGIGIAPEHLDKMFQPFTQIDCALNRKYEGTGLGLALVKRLVEHHKGKVHVSSKMGLGSAFTIDLPYCPSQQSPSSEATDTAVQTPVVTPQSVPLRSPHPKLLLVDDSTTNILTMSSYLRARGYQLVVAQNGREAIAQAQSERPDLILMDIQMPVMDGLEAIQQIKADPQLAHIPILAVTVLASEEDRRMCLAAGANDYLSKPVKLKHLVTIIQQLLAT